MSIPKRYTFWRAGDGKPYHGVDGKFAPTELLAKYGRSAMVNAEGKISWQGFGSNQIEVALKMAFVVISPDGDDLDDSDAWGLFRRAMLDECRATGGGCPLDSGNVLHRADAFAADYFRRVPKSYVLVSCLSVASLPTKEIRIAGCTIRALSSRQRYPVPPVIAKSDPRSVIGVHCAQTRYQWLAVSTKGRSHSDAARRALRALNLLRALWTIAETYGKWTMRFGRGSPKPLSVIHTGPYHTLHNPDGSPVGDFYWRENDPREDRELLTPSRGWSDVERVRQSMTKQFPRLAYRSDIEQLVVRYVSALDQTDHDLALLQMWTILEKVTDTVGAKYDETIKRASWFLSDRALGKQLLDCIRIQRNRYVHAAHSSDEPDQAAYLIKSLLEPHLIALIFNHYRVASLSEYADILSMPVDVSTLTKLKRRVAMALSVHGTKPRARGARNSPEVHSTGPIISKADGESGRDAVKSNLAESTSDEP